MKKIIIAVLVIISVVLFVYLFAIFQTPDSGQHTGFVTSVEKSGFIIKTWTAYIKTDPQSSQEDTYCVTDPKVIADLQNYEKARLPITIYYHSPIILWKWQCTIPNSIINSVSPANQSTTTVQ